MINDQFPLKGSSREMGRDGHAPPEEVDAPGSRLTFGFGSSDCGSFAARLPTGDTERRKTAGR